MMLSMHLIVVVSQDTYSQFGFHISSEGSWMCNDMYKLVYLWEAFLEDLTHLSDLCLYLFWIQVLIAVIKKLVSEDGPFGHKTCLLICSFWKHFCRFRFPIIATNNFQSKENLHRTGDMNRNQHISQ